jgi:hypothetical protein
MSNEKFGLDSKRSITGWATSLGSPDLHFLETIPSTEEPVLFAETVVQLQADLRTKANRRLEDSVPGWWIGKNPPEWEPSAAGTFPAILLIGRRAVCLAAAAVGETYTAGSAQLKERLTAEFAVSFRFVRRQCKDFSRAKFAAELRCEAAYLDEPPIHMVPAQHWSDGGWLESQVEAMKLLPGGVG